MIAPVIQSIQTSSMTKIGVPLAKATTVRCKTVDKTLKCELEGEAVKHFNIERGTGVPNVGTPKRQVEQFTSSRDVVLESPGNRRVADVWDECI